MAQLPAGPVTQLDLARLFPSDDYGPVVAELRPGEWDRLVAHHAAVADPSNAATDGLWWNWCRMPAGTSTTTRDPASVAMVAGNVPLVSAWLERELVAEPSPVPAREALVAV